MFRTALRPLQPPKARGRERTASLPATLLAVALAGAWSAAQAQNPTAATRRAEVSAAAVEQKAVMVDRLIFNSPVATRVVGSQNDEARRHFNNARELYTHGRALASTGQLRAADLLLNEAIWEIGRAQTLVPDPAARVAEERARYQQLRDSVDALLRTQQIGQPVATTTRGDGPGERTAARVQAQLDQARQLADDSKLVEANRVLDQALGVLLKDTLHNLDGKTLIYDRRFANVREEFAYELARHRSYEGLVPLAVLEYRPSREALALIDRYVQQSKSLRSRAEQQAAAADHAGGVQTLAEATDVLQRALQAAGLAVPQTMAGP
jgi:hypothetical protein